MSLGFSVEKSLNAFPFFKKHTKIKNRLSLGEFELNFLRNRTQIGIVGGNNLCQTLFVVPNPIFSELTFIAIKQSLLNFLAIRRFDVEADWHQP